MTQDEFREHKVKVLLLEPKSVAKEAILNIAQDLDISYTELMEQAYLYVSTGETMYVGDREDLWLPDEFWGHYEVVKETKVTNDKRGSFFRCAC